MKEPGSSTKRFRHCPTCLTRRLRSARLAQEAKTQADCGEPLLPHAASVDCFLTSSIEASAVRVSVGVVIDMRCPLSPTRTSSVEPRV
jgi:hypothetical protein